MIPRDYITEWRAQMPWPSDEQVEQDLIISRAIVEIFSSDVLANRLAWRGGTALHKIYLTPAARYSEDIDLVQVAAEPIGVAFDAIRSVLDPWLGEPRRALKEERSTLVYFFYPEMFPQRKMRLKIEINSREHFTELRYVHKEFGVCSRWWEGHTEVVTYPIEELLGTKLRALFQRKKGRDLFDLWCSTMKGAPLPPRVLACFGRYMQESDARVSRAEFEENLANKLRDPTFGADVRPLLRPEIDWDVHIAAEKVRKAFLAELPGHPWQGT